MKVAIFTAVLLVVPWLIAVGLGVLPRGHRVGLGLLLTSLTYVADINLAAHLEYRGMSKSIDISTIDIAAFGLLIFLLLQARKRGFANVAPSPPLLRTPVLRTPALSFAFLFFLAMNLLSLVGAYSLTYGAYDIVKLVRGMLIFWIAANMIVDDDMADALPAFLSIFVVIEVAYAAYDFFVLKNWWVAATFAHKNQFAFILNLFLPFLFARALLKPRWRLLYLALFLAGVACVIVSRSRTAWFTMILASGVTVVGACYVVLRRGGRLKDLTQIVAIVVILVAMAVPVGIKMSDGIIARWGESREVTLDFRVTNNAIAVELANTYPFGVGTNNYVHHLETPVARELPELDRTVAHNAYLLVAAETGWIGFFAFVLLWLSYAAVALRLTRNAKSLRGVYVGVGALGGVVACLIHGTTESGPMLRAHPYFIICTVMGLVVGVAQREGFGRVSPLAWLQRGGAFRRHVRRRR